VLSKIARRLLGIPFKLQKALLHFVVSRMYSNPQQFLPITAFNGSRHSDRGRRSDNFI
jgi:hypothetical protein